MAGIRQQPEGGRRLPHSFGRERAIAVSKARRVRGLLVVKLPYNAQTIELASLPLTSWIGKDRRSSIHRL